MKKIFDEVIFRMFGTFEAERQDVKIVYGLVDQPQFFNPLKHQVGLAYPLNMILLWKGLHS
jgi:hypothetical protein